jgi:hypothetical protein
MLVPGDAGQQIPFGNDRKKGKSKSEGKGKSKSRSFTAFRMTNFLFSHSFTPFRQVFVCTRLRNGMMVGRILPHR